MRCWQNPSAERSRPHASPPGPVVEPPPRLRLRIQTGLSTEARRRLCPLSMSEPSRMERLPSARGGRRSGTANDCSRERLDGRPMTDLGRVRGRRRRI